METTRVFENANSYMKPLSQQELSQANSEEFSYTMDEFNNHNIATTNHEGSTNADEIQKVRVPIEFHLETLILLGRQECWKMQKIQAEIKDGRRKNPWREQKA